MHDLGRCGEEQRLFGGTDGWHFRQVIEGLFLSRAVAATEGAGAFAYTPQALAHAGLGILAGSRDRKASKPLLHLVQSDQ